MPTALRDATAPCAFPLTAGDCANWAWLLCVSLLCEAKGNRLTITATDLELGIRTGCEAKVKKEGSGTIGNTVPGAGRQRWDEGRLAQLEGKMGQQALEIDFLKGCFRRIDEQRKLQAVTGKTAVSTSRSRPKGTEPKP